MPRTVPSAFLTTVAGGVLRSDLTTAESLAGLGSLGLNSMGVQSWEGLREPGLPVRSYSELRRESDALNEAIDGTVEQLERNDELLRDPLDVAQPRSAESEQELLEAHEEKQLLMPHLESMQSDAEFLDLQLHVLDGSPQQPTDDAFDVFDSLEDPFGDFQPDEVPVDGGLDVANAGSYSDYDSAIG